MAGNTARNYGGAGGNMVPRSTKLTEALANAAPQAGTTRSGGGSGYSYNMNGTPMGPQEVQDVVAQNAQNAVNAAAGTNAAQAAALQLEPGLQVNGMGQNGTGNWYSLLGAGGKVDPNNAALFLAMNPGAYNSPYTPAMQTLMNQLLNPEQFRYDVNADGLYQQIKDNYMKAGKQAMMDTQGQSAALTGGYGNSYGAMAGQQAYQESLGGLAGMIPELQQLAYQQYLNGEDAKRNNLEALNKLNEQEYARWMDDMAAYVQALGNLQLPMGNSGGGGGDPGVVGGPMNPFGKFLVTAGPTGSGQNGNISMQEWGAWEDLANKNPGLMSQMVQHVLNGGTLTDVHMPTARAYAKKVQDNIQAITRHELDNTAARAEQFRREEGGNNSLHDRIMHAAGK